MKSKLFFRQRKTPAGQGRGLASILGRFRWLGGCYHYPNRKRASAWLCGGLGAVVGAGGAGRAMPPNENTPPV